MAIQLVPRRGWGARAPKGNYDRIASTKGTKVHYTGGAEKPAMATNHGLCAARVRAIQAQHMDGNGWLDIGYSLIVCPHRTVFEGRGLHNLPAANGPGLNGGHYAVLGLVGNSGLTEPSEDMLHGIRDAIEYLRASGGAGVEIKGHRDGYATDCPGGPLYAWVRAGAPRPKVSAPPKPTDPTEVLVKKLPTLGEGDTGWDVKTVHHLLLARDAKGLDDVDPTVFTPAHTAATKTIQRAAGLKADGLVGAATWPVLLRVA